LMGVFSHEKVDLVAQTMARLGVRHGMVVHGADGLDELTLTGPTSVIEIRGGAAKRYEFVPEELGLARVPPEALKGADTAEGNAEILEAIFYGADQSPHAGARRDVVALNAAACLMVAGVAASLRDGLARAREALESRAAARLVENLRASATAQLGLHPKTSL
jgi:anthranilate phosphoribosyltransferase